MVRKARPVSIKIGRFIKKRREEMGLSQVALGKLLQYQYGNYIAMIEAANASFPLERWRDYADALQVPRHEFLKLVLEDAFPEMMPYIDGFSDPVERNRASKSR
jgi:hypothetical protein